MSGGTWSSCLPFGNTVSSCRYSASHAAFLGRRTKPFSIIARARRGDVLMVALAGLGNGIAQFWWTRSLSLAPPSAVVPFNYLSLVWATILGYAVWGDVPTPGLLVGSTIVVASGLYILWRETVRHRRPSVPAPQRV